MADDKRDGDDLAAHDASAAASHPESLSDGSVSSDGPTRLEDLARIAGVSIATISRALNNSPAVNAETKKRIWQLAREHQYAFRPHMPSMLSTANASITLALPTPTGRDASLSDPFYMELVASIGEAARAKHCSIVVSPDAPQNFDALRDLAESNRTDGMLFLGQGALHERFNRLVDYHKRFVVWGAELPKQRYCSVGSDNFLGGRKATAHLVRLGRKNIAFVGNSHATEVAQRFDGYVAALQEGGIALRQDLIQPAAFELEAASVTISEMLDRVPALDGIFAAGDLIAIGAVRALQRAGRRVPDDVSVVGYDDILLSRYHNPTITTVSQDLLQGGRLMVAKLLAAEGGSPIRSERIPTDLVVRESCGA